MAIGLPAAFLAGILMFLAPCTLPIVPGYLAFIAGGGANRRRVFLNALAFTLGFSLVFILLGTFAAALGAFLGPWRDALGRAAGIIIILFGLTMLGLVRVPALERERRLRLPHFLTLGRPESSALIGALFALGWSPCVGPILGGILFLAAGSATAAQGALLLAVFSLGLAVPFWLTALALEGAGRFFARWTAITRALSIFGGVVLVVLGALMLAGQMGQLVSWGFSTSPAWSGLLHYM